MPAGEEQLELEREEHHIVIVQPQREGLEGQTGGTHVVSGCRSRHHSVLELIINQYCMHDPGKRQRCCLN